jgi:UDPglucose--hexose-1-phosphate uridylyltransferase
MKGQAKMDETPNELRKDYILDRWAIMAVERAKRPTDFHTERVDVQVQKECPFCPDNEAMTPPATLVYLQKDGEILKDRDTNGSRQKGWLVRCFPNLYPALRATVQEAASPDKFLLRRGAFGFHEIVVESPNHREHPGIARLDQLRLAFDAQLDLLKRFYCDKRVKYVQIFRNHGREAGASLSHTHTQIMALPLVPRLIMDEVKSAEHYFKDRGRCAFCKIIEEEKEGPRLIFESASFFAFAPWASIHPFEFWILPKRHESSLLEIHDSEKKDFVKTLRVSLGALRKLLHDPPYNYGFHIAPNSSEEDKGYHWHLEVYPKLATWAGFELSSGMYINTASPEMVAETLQEYVRIEVKEIEV